MMFVPDASDFISPSHWGGFGESGRPCEGSLPTVRGCVASPVVPGPSRLVLHSHAALRATASAH